MLIIKIMLKNLRVFISPAPAVPNNMAALVTKAIKMCFAKVMVTTVGVIISYAVMY